MEKSGYELRSRTNTHSSSPSRQRSAHSPTMERPSHSNLNDDYGGGGGGGGDNEDEDYNFAMEGSSLVNKIARFGRNFEAGVFGLLFLMSRDKVQLFKGRLGLFVATLEFFFFLSFIFSGDFPWSTSIIPLQKFADIISITAEQLGGVITLYVLFILVVGIILIMVILSLKIAAGDQGSSFHRVSEIKMQRTFVGICMSFFYIPFLRITIAPMECTTRESRVVLSSFPDVQCFHGIHWLFFFLAFIMLFVFVPFALLMALLYYEPQSTSGDWLARPVNRVDFLYTLGRTILVFVTWLAKSSLPVRAFVVFMVNMILLLAFLIFPPYYRYSPNILRVVMFSLSTCCAFFLCITVAVNNESDTGPIYSMIACIPFTVLGFVFLAYLRMKKFYTEPTEESLNQIKVRYTEYAAANMLQRLFKFSDILLESFYPASLELKTRFLTKYEMSPARVAHAKVIFMNGLLVYPGDVAVMMIFSLFLQTYDQKNATVEIQRLLLEIQYEEGATRSNYSNSILKQGKTRPGVKAKVGLDIRFLKFYIQKGVEQEMEMHKRGHDSLGIIDYVFLRRHTHLAKSYQYLSLMISRDFWKIILDAISVGETASIDTLKLQRLAAKVDDTSRQGIANFEVLLNKYGDNPLIIRMTGTFLLQVEKDLLFAKDLFTLADALEHSRSKRNNDDAVVQINREGIILQWNPAATLLLGFTPSEAIGQNVSIIVGDPHKARHDEYLSKYRETGKSKVIGKSRVLPATHKNGTTIHVRISLFAFDNGEIQGILRLCDDEISANSASLVEQSQLFIANVDSASEGIVVTDKSGSVLAWNIAMSTLLGYRRDETIGRNIKFIVPEPHKSRHNLYIKHFNDSGGVSTRLMGQTRNLSAVKKNGAAIQISIRLSNLPDGSFCAIMRDGWDAFNISGNASRSISTNNNNITTHPPRPVNPVVKRLGDSTSPPTIVATSPLQTPLSPRLGMSGGDSQTSNASLGEGVMSDQEDDKQSESKMSVGTDPKSLTKTARSAELAAKSHVSRASTTGQSQTTHTLSRIKHRSTHNRNIAKARNQRSKAVRSFINTLMLSFLFAVALSVAVFINYMVSIMTINAEVGVQQYQREMEENLSISLFYSLLLRGSPEDSNVYAEFYKPTLEIFLGSFVKIYQEATTHSFMSNFASYMRDSGNTYQARSFFESAIDRQSSIQEAPLVNFTRWEYGIKLSQVLHYLADSLVPVRNLTSEMKEDAIMMNETVYDNSETSILFVSENLAEIQHVIIDLRTNAKTLANVVLNDSLLVYEALGIAILLMVVAMAFMWRYTFGKVRDEITSYRYLTKLPKEIVQRLVDHYNGCLRTLDKSYEGKSRNSYSSQAAQYMTRDATSKNEEKYLVQRFFVCLFLLATLGGLIWYMIASIEVVSSRILRSNYLDDVDSDFHFILIRTSSLLSNSDPLKTQELSNELFDALNRLELDYSLILAKDIEESNDVMMRYHVSNCGTLNEMNEFFRSLPDKITHLNLDEVWMERYPNNTDSNMLIPPLHILVQQFTSLHRDYIADADVITSFNATYRRNYIVENVKVESFTLLEGCLGLLAIQYEVATASATSDAMVLIPVLFWIFIPLALMLYYRYLPQEFAEQTAILSMQCQRMFKQLPIMQAANASDDVRKYLISTGLMKEYVSRRSGVGGVDEDGNETLEDSEQSLGELSDHDNHESDHQTKHKNLVGTPKTKIKPNNKIESDDEVDHFEDIMPARGIKKTPPSRKKDSLTNVTNASMIKITPPSTPTFNVGSTPPLINSILVITIIIFIYVCHLLHNSMI